MILYISMCVYIYIYYDNMLFGGWLARAPLFVEAAAMRVTGSASRKTQLMLETVCARKCPKGE